MNNDVLNIINIDKMIGMEYPNSNSAYEFTIRINDIETTPTLYTISIDYGVEHYNAATIIVNRVKNFKVVDVLGYDIELLLNGFPNMNTYNDKAVFTIDMFETSTIFLIYIKNLVEREINNLPF